MRNHPWRQVVAVACLLAWASLASNIQPYDQMVGRANPAKAARLVFSYLLNSGTAWAGAPVLAGWLVAARRTGDGRTRWVEAGLAGLVVAELSLAVHYATGLAIGFFEASVWVENQAWFLWGLACLPLGMVGALARHRGALGVLARLVVPLGALAEPFVLGMFAQPAFLPWPNRLAHAVVGALLVASGLVGAVLVLVGEVTRRRPPRVPGLSRG